MPKRQKRTKQKPRIKKKCYDRYVRITSRLVQQEDSTHDTGSLLTKSRVSHHHQSQPLVQAEDECHPSTPNISRNATLGIGPSASLALPPSVRMSIQTQEHVPAGHIHLHHLKISTLLPKWQTKVSILWSKTHLEKR